MRLFGYPLLLTATVLASLDASSTLAEKPRIVSVSRIWNRAPHNAFTDLIRFRGRWFCTFREGKSHAGDVGKVRLAKPVKIDAGRRACFYDVDGDGRLDGVGLMRNPKAETIFFTRPPTFSPAQPAMLRPKSSQTIRLTVGDDVMSAHKQGESVRVVLRIQASPGNGRHDLIVRFNDQVLKNERHSGTWIEYTLRLATVKKGENRVVITRGSGARRNPVLRDRHRLPTTGAVRVSLLHRLRNGEVLHAIRTMHQNFVPRIVAHR